VKYESNENVLEAAQAKSKERVWLKQRSQGELDDSKLVDGIAGETRIYKARGKDDPIQGTLPLPFPCD
jgi:hypothetical protein